MATEARFFRRWRLVAAALLPLVAGCEERSPYAVSRARHPEYYDDASGVLPERHHDSGEAEAAAPNDLGELPGETVELAAADADGPGHPLDLRAALLSGALRIGINDPSPTGGPAALFDGDITTMVRTQDVNPMILVFRLPTPIRLVAVRIYPSFSTYDWAVRPEPLGSRWRIRHAAESQWSRVDLPAPVETTEIRLEVRRLERDNYVHLNEVELLVAE